MIELKDVVKTTLAKEKCKWINIRINEDDYNFIQKNHIDKNRLISLVLAELKKHK